MAEVPFLYVALDHNDRDANLALAKDLSALEGPFGYKINQDHHSLWPGYQADIQAMGKDVFVDTKINNGSRTMANIMREIAQRGARHTNVWALAEKLIPRAAKTLEGTPTQLLGVTVTTHFTEEYCQHVFRRSLPDSVRMLSDMALTNGCHGLILPGTTLEAVRDLAVPKLVPAVRPTWFADTKANDQEQPVTPTEAVQGGATFLVCGSPIYKDTRPQVALGRILEEIALAAK